MTTTDTNDFWFTTARVSVHLSRADNADGLSVMEHSMAADFAPPRHVHHDEDETFHILDGRFRFERGAEILHAQAGDTIHIGRGVPHGFRVISPEGGRFLTMTRGGFEAMVRQVSRPADYVGLPKQVEPSDAAKAMLAAACNANGIDLIGPPIA